MIEKGIKRIWKEAQIRMTKLPELDVKTYTNIEQAVKNTHAEKTREVLGESLYTHFVNIATTPSELSVLLRAVDICLNAKPVGNTPVFDSLGNRLEVPRLTLEETVTTTKLDFLYRTIEELGSEYPFARAIIEELYLVLFNEMKEGRAGFGTWINTVKRLEQDLTDADRELQNYFVMLAESGNENLLVYNYHLSLRDQGVTIKGLINETWQEELEAQTSKE